MKEDDSGGFGDFDSDSVHTLGFSDQLHDFKVEVDVEFFVFLVSDDQGGLESSLGLLDFIAPRLVVPHFVDGELLSESVVGSVVTFNFVGVDHVFGEHVDRSSNLLEEMSSPNDFAGIWRHVSHDWGVSFLVSEDSLDSV